jgi:hypothetical protein
MPGIEQRYEQLIRYLKGLLSDRQRHDFEKEMMRDAFDEEALDGFSMLPGEEFEADMKGLYTRLDEKTEKNENKNRFLFYRIAAGILLLAGVAGIFMLVLRRPAQNLITEEKTGTMQPFPAAAEPQIMPDTVIYSESRSIERSKIRSEKPAMAEKAEPSEVISVVQEMPRKDYNLQVSETVAVEAEPVLEEKKEAEVSRQLAAAAPPVAKVQTARNIATAKVIDMDGNPIPGVNVIEKGSMKGTVTDVEGNFSLQPFDSGAILTFNYVGYVPVEKKISDASGNVIRMTEDITALDEIVVVGYGSRKKSDVTGAVSVIDADDITDAGKSEAYDYIKPVPPHGSVKSFKEWVMGRVDFSVFGTSKGKQKIQVNFTVHANGSLSDITIRETVPAPVAAEFKRIIAQSPRWTPAMKNNNPVEAKVSIRFIIEIE